MKKFFTIFLILSLISFTAIIKNSTKRIDDMIFISQENIRGLNNDLESIRLENDYLSSTEKLLEFQNLYLDEKLVQIDIKQIKTINKQSNKLEIEQFRFINE